MPDMEKLVTIQQFEDPLQAHMAKQILEDQGIEVFMTGHNVASTLPLPGVAIVLIQTRESDAQNAKEILSNSLEGWED